MMVRGTLLERQGGRKKGGGGDGTGDTGKTNSRGGVVGSPSPKQVALKVASV